MGHLALRYRDAARSGVYRVADATVPAAAAAEAGAILSRLALSDDPGRSALDTVLADPRPEPRVVIVHGADALATPGELEALLARLGAAAAAGRKRGAPFFAVLVDPRSVLALPALYRESASAG
jgi:hypothetical protein